ncbi:MAG TPA: DUF417 family protein [Candidatus Binataceae bacterium]|nr:DUF417 family protein [Candidatus Binataceae bacterium]
MNYLMKRLVGLFETFGMIDSDIDYHVLRSAMVLIFAFFGYQKWFQYEAQALIPYISNGPLIFWMYPVFGIRGACLFLGVSEWVFGSLIFMGFWNKTAGVIGALGGIASFVSTTTIIPFMPDGWAASAGGFPAMTERVAFLMKDFALLAVSFYLLKQDLLRLSTIQSLGNTLSAPAESSLPAEAQKRTA